MELSVTDALRDGLGRTFERNGLQLVAVFLAIRFASLVANDTLTRANLALGEELGTLPGGFAAETLPGLAETPTPFALALGLSTAYFLFVTVAILGEAVRIVAVRTLVSDRRDVIPAEYRWRNLVAATVNGFVGGIVVMTLTVIGLVLLVIPGVYLALSFFFVRQEIAVEDRNFIDAMAASWELTSGNRLGLLGLAFALALVGLVASIPGFLLGTTAPTVGVTLTAVARAVVVVFSIAAVCRAYHQLKLGDTGSDSDAPDYEGALGPEDLPPPDADGW